MESKKCKFCGHVIETYTKENVEYLMLQHLIAKHRDKIEIREKK